MGGRQGVVRVNINGLERGELKIFKMIETRQFDSGLGKFTENDHVSVWSNKPGTAQVGAISKAQK